jgi:hypothetical protein
LIRMEKILFFDFVFPYVNEINFSDPGQYFSTLVITGRNVRIGAEPNMKSDVVAMLTYDVVHYDYEKSDNKEWYFVETLDKKISGYVSSKFVYSPIDYRMFLTKETGHWMISCVVAGD